NTGNANGLTRTTTLSLTVNAQAAPDYTLSASPSSLTVTHATSRSSPISVSPLNRFTGSVTLSAAGLPDGVTAAFGPNPTATTSTLTLPAKPTAPTRPASDLITGTANGLTRTTTLSLTVNAQAAPDYTLSASPGS